MLDQASEHFLSFSHTGFVIGPGNFVAAELPASTKCKSVNFQKNCHFSPL